MRGTNLGSFRPRTGDYFFIRNNMALIGLTQDQKFPSPYWGLFFYQYFPLIDEKCALRFPSQYWGLFFYRKKVDEPKMPLFKVSVPVLGIIFLSYRSNNQRYNSIW